ncbi:MAG: O-antigen ligase family protein [Oligoflexia bacterium]|nr:O-antigen ligase family protein [Oligoflexia bacterium]
MGDWFEKHKVSLALGALFFLPLKLFFAYAFLVPAVVLWIFFRMRSFLRDPQQRAWFGRVVAPLYLYMLVTITSAIFGLDFFRSFSKLLSMAFFTLTIPFFWEVAALCSPVKIISALLAGQTLAALHSVCEGAFPSLPSFFLGKVTESGQLGLSVIAGGGVLLYATALQGPARSGKFAPNSLAIAPTTTQLLQSVAAFLLLAAAGLSGHFGTGGTQRALLLAAAITSIAFGLLKIRAAAKPLLGDLDGLRNILLTVVLPLLGAALLINLKRGPWSGVLAGGLILTLIYGKKYMIPLAFLACIALLQIEPVRSRLMNSMDDFYIRGGRAAIWDVGIDLMQKYPLGIGYKNSAFLTEFSDEIPPELRHFHNNLLNIVVESGWLGLGVYVWWLLSIIRACFHRPHASAQSILAVAVGAAIISWQIAGLVEYNFGDSEVLLIAFALLGVMTAIRSGQARITDLEQPVTWVPVNGTAPIAASKGSQVDSSLAL